MKIGYARVSSKDQNIERQIEEFKKYGVKKIFQEKKSGATIAERPEFQKALEFCREEDIFFVEAIDRLGRNYDEIIETINFLKQKGVSLVVTSLPITLDTIGSPLLDKFVKDLLLQVLAMIAEQERTESKRRQAQGIKLAKERGAYKGRPFDYSENSSNAQKRAIYFRIKEMLGNEVPIMRIAKDNGVSRKTVYRIKRELSEIEN